MRWLLLVLASCTTGTLRVGGVMVGEHPAFQASIEFGSAIGGAHSVQITHEHGVAAGEHTEYVGAIDADYVIATDDDAPLARVGPRMRFADTSAALELRSTLFTGMFDDAKTRSGGFGIEIAGGYDFVQVAPVFEAAMVIHGRWPMD